MTYESCSLVELGFGLSLSSVVVVVEADLLHILCSVWHYTFDSDSLIHTERHDDVPGSCNRVFPVL